MLFPVAYNLLYFAMIAGIPPPNGFNDGNFADFPSTDLAGCVFVATHFVYRPLCQKGVVKQFEAPK